MSDKELVRGANLFLDCDLAWRAAPKAGVDPNNPYLKPSDYRVSELGVTFIASGVTVQLDELGLGELLRVDTQLLSEYANLSEFIKAHVSFDLPFACAPCEGRWYIKKSDKKRLFERWGNQLATGANTFVL